MSEFLKTFKLLRNATDLTAANSGTSTAITLEAKGASMNLPPDDRRRMPRFELNLPLELDRGDGGPVMAVTRDVSAGGVYFYLDLDIPSGSSIEFVVTFPPEITLVKSLRVRCTGRVLRVDKPLPQGIGVATEIQRYEFLTSSTSAIGAA